MTNEISANRISLYDEKGNLRILLDAGGEEGFAAISLFGKDRQRIQISVQPDGSVGIELGGNNGKTVAAVGVTAQNESGISLHNDQGELGTLLGADILSAEPGRRRQHTLRLFKDGQLAVTLAAGSLKDRC